jgi:hypothetical protein
LSDDLVRYLPTCPIPSHARHFHLLQPSLLAHLPNPLREGAPLHPHLHPRAVPSSKLGDGVRFSGSRVRVLGHKEYGSGILASILVHRLRGLGGCMGLLSQLQMPTTLLIDLLVLASRIWYWASLRLRDNNLLRPPISLMRYFDSFRGQLRQLSSLQQDHHSQKHRGAQQHSRGGGCCWRDEGNHKTTHDAQKQDNTNGRE